MNPSDGMVQSLNAIREMIVSENAVYGADIPVITSNTTIGEYGTFINTPEVFNEWCDKLVKRIIYTGIKSKTFNNPLQDLEGEAMPLGYAGQEIYINPVKPRKFNVNDFAGLLRKYEADVKVEYTSVNADLQFPLTIQRDKMRSAFTSWATLEDEITAQINAIYNGAYIKRYELTKGLVSNAYKDNAVQIKTVTNVTTEATGKAFIKQVRKDALNFKSPSSAYNAWAKVGGYGNAIVTWSDVNDIYFLVRNDILAEVDVDVLAEAFNMDKVSFMGKVIGVDDFSLYADDGEKVVDGSKILGILADRAWFRIRTQEFTMESDFYNSNNRTRQYYLNDVRMYNYSRFANAVVYATEMPTVPASSASFVNTEVTVEEDATVKVPLSVIPFQATVTPVYSSSAEGKATVEADSNNPRIAVITGVDDGSATITATLGTVTATVSVTVTAKSA